MIHNLFFYTYAPIQLDFYWSQKIFCAPIGFKRAQTKHSSEADFFSTCIHTVGELKDWTKCHLWSKTTLNTGGMGGAGVDPPTCKMGTFFLMSLTLTEPSLNNFQLNGGKWPSLKL